ncbi:MAG TPA: methyltransferase domain-containing protein [Candidatus Polarisedimenticolia bacterium]|nr:methyltransferase domain-containing protein [Candidatus Polarisedimenticolia bacterium]
MRSSTNSETLAVESAVHERYARGARQREESLCCATEYEARYLEAIPREVVERDYGCGDPSSHVREGDTVLDLGSGGGKICFIASQIVGPGGRVVGVDANEEMLELARGAAPEVARRTGCANVSFRRGNIQDLRLDLDLLDEWLRDHPVGGASDLPALEEAARRLRRERPLVPDASMDLVISNCVLNLVRENDKPPLLQEIFRVLKPGGRIALSDIVSDEVVPEDLKQDAELWSGCVSGAFQEGELLRGLASVGFYGVGIERWKEEPFRVVRGIEFRSVTVTARKGKEGPCFEGNQAVLYKGPWKQVEDDDHHVLRRGERTAVCDKTYRILTSEPYADQIIPIPSRIEIAAEDRKAFDCSRTAPRHPRETKGEAYTATTEGDGACCPPGSCC